jgi:riboflavin biosynthesis pyrimidine reductase
VAVTFNRLFPTPGAVSVDELLSDWESEIRAPSHAARPRLSLNFAVTADGSASLADGKSGGIGGSGDLEVFRALRDRVDAVMAGTATIATEGYRRICPVPGRRQQREQRGLAADPLAVTLSRSGVLPLDAPIFNDPDQSTIAFVPSGISGSITGGVEYVELEPVTPGAALGHLAGIGVASVLCEGGPRLMSALAAEDLIDDVFLTVSPMLAGGGQGLTSGAPLETPTPLALRHIAEHDGAMLIRWARSN